MAKLKERELLAKANLEREKNYNRVAKANSLKYIDLLEDDEFGDERRVFLESIENEESSQNGVTQKSFLENLGFKKPSKWVKANVGYSTSFANVEKSDSTREALGLTLTVNPISYFFMGTTLKLDINDYNNIYYQPDFSYSFGYSDWHQDTFSFGYSNYANNKFSPKEGEDRFNFQSGTWEVGYKNKVEGISLSTKAKYVPITDSKKVFAKAKTTVNGVMLSAQLKHTIETKQNRITLASKTIIYDKFFVSGSAYLYPEPSLKRSSDPDYAYSFGWKDSRPFYPSITYSNYYTPTRWSSSEGPKFKEGSLSLKFNLKF